MSNTLGNTEHIQEANLKKDTLSVLVNPHLLAHLLSYIILIFNTEFSTALMFIFRIQVAMRETKEFYKCRIFSWYVFWKYLYVVEIPSSGIHKTLSLSACASLGSASK